MTEYIKNRVELFVVLILFTMSKIPHLLFPFYWDESWPYVPAIREMYNHGISLLPTAIDPNLSRGHPLFFHAAGAAWMHIFGTSNKALHGFALFISLSFLVVIYEAGYRIFNRRVAFIALLLVVTQVAFYVQSSFVLFEVLIAFLSFLSIYLYVEKKYFFATLSLTALFLTKESGLIAGFVIGVDALIAFFRKDESFKRKLLKLMPVTVACLSIGLFFLIQKHTRGWYVFPLYSETVLHKWQDIWYRFRTCSIRTTFCLGYEHIIFFALLVYALIAAIKGPGIKVLTFTIIAIPVFLVYYLIDDDRSVMFVPVNIGVTIFCIFIIAYIATLYTYGSRVFNGLLQRKLILLMGFFVLCFILFSSVAYFIPRYLLASIIPALFLVAVFFDRLIRQSFSFLFYPLIAVIFITAFYSFKESKGWGDIEMGFRFGIKTQQGIVEFLERSNFFDKHIATGSFLQTEHLTDYNTGFLSNNQPFNHVGSDIDSTTDLVIFDNIEPDPRYDAIKKDTSFEMIYRVEMHGVWSEVYKKNSKWQKNSL
jgi:hypothetical protein